MPLLWCQRHLSLSIPGLIFWKKDMRRDPEHIHKRHNQSTIQQPDIVRRLRLNLGHLKTCAAQWDPTLQNTFSIYKNLLFKHLVYFLFRKHLVAYFKRILRSKAPIPSPCISAPVSQSFFEPPPLRDLAVFPTTLKLRIRYTIFLAESGRMNLVGPTNLWSHRV